MMMKRTSRPFDPERSDNLPTIVVNGNQAKAAAHRSFPTLCVDMHPAERVIDQDRNSPVAADLLAMLVGGRSGISKVSADRRQAGVYIGIALRRLAVSGNR